MKESAIDHNISEVFACKNVHNSLLHVYQDMTAVFAFLQHLKIASSLRNALFIAVFKKMF
jgi:hypothetical protein